MYWRKLQKKLTNYNIKEELEEIMRSISSAIISFVIFYIGLCFPKKEIKQHMIRGSILCLSCVILIVSFILMILGLWWKDNSRLEKSFMLKMEVIMLTEKEIQIVMNALNGTPTLTTSKFADKIETILRKYKENKDE